VLLRSFVRGSAEAYDRVRRDRVRSGNELDQRQEMPARAGRHRREGGGKAHASGGAQPPERRVDPAGSRLRTARAVEEERGRHGQHVGDPGEPPGAERKPVLNRRGRSRAYHLSIKENEKSKRLLQAIGKAAAGRKR
jgi:hypothetical protein